jgi:hypothetical protein
MAEWALVAAPAEFLVVRHRLSHPSDSAAELSRHVGLDRAVVSRVEARIRKNGLWQENQLLEHMRALSRRPVVKRVHFRAPNPKQWFLEFSGRYWQSGEHVAASLDGMDVVPERFLVYVAPEDFDAAVRAAHDIIARLAPAPEGNLEIRVADPWLREGEQPNVAERGQRLLDYAESKHIQLLRGLRLG